MPIDASVPASGQDVSKAAMRNNFAAIKAKVDTLPESWASRQPGELLVVNDDLTGPAPAGTDEAAITGSGRPIRGVRPPRVPVAGNMSLTENSHLGAELKITAAGAVVLQVELNADPALGVRDGFECRIYRPEASGSVQISSSTLTNGRSDGLDKVAAGGKANLSVDAENMTWLLLGYTES